MPFFDESTVITDNAVRKIKEYSLDWDSVKDAYYHPTRTESPPIPNCTSFIKDYKDSEVGVIAKKVDGGKWLIVSVWWRKLY